MDADRISELSDSILCNILSFVPTKLAATTSILSKRWKSVWLFVFTLDFKDETFEDFQSFTNFMSSVMSTRDIALPIYSFTFNCANDSFPYDLKVLNRSVNLAVQQGELENLNLHMPLHSTITFQMLRKIELAPSIFSCRTLQVLNLSNLILTDITSHHQLDLPLLKILHWKGVVFKSVSYIIKLLSSCPILEELHASYSHILDYTDPVQKNVKVVLPKLIKARFADPNCPISLLSEAENLHLQTVWIYSICS